MKVLITCPGITPHGGIRIILEWANRLLQWNDVTVYCLKKGRPDWFSVDPRVKWITSAPREVHDIAILTSPHAMRYVRALRSKKKFIFCQMHEALFQPDNRAWQKLCAEFYTAPYPMLSISKWNMEVFEKEYGRIAPTYYIGNGVNLDHFPISTKPKDFKTVLIEGWESSNPSKDPDQVGPLVAAWLKADGYRILAYSGLPLKTMPYVPDEYYCRPSLEKMNELYERATILIKASKYDARSCAPIEAMTKGTPTARAIIKGDDDLIDRINCRRVGYSAGELYVAAKELIATMRMNFVETELNWEHSWDHWMPIINAILITNE